MTTVQLHSDGYWLRLEPIVCTPRRGRRGVLAAAGVVVGLVTIGTLLLGTTPAKAPTTEQPPPAEAAAVVSMPAPPAELAASFERWGREYGVPVALLEALTWHESRWHPSAVSEAGAMGIGQLMPPTAEALEASIGEPLDPWIADDNVRMSAHLLGTLLTSSGRDVPLALAGYAQGASSVARDGMTASTRQYVAEMTVLYDQFRAARDVRGAAT